MSEKIKSYLSEERLYKIRIRVLAAMICFTLTAITMLGRSINIINIFDGEATYTVNSYSGNVNAAIANVKLKYPGYRIVDTQIKNNCTNVKIVYSFPVYITKGSTTSEIEFEGGTVKDALLKAGYTPDEHDFIEPAPDTVITESAYIDYTDIDYTEITCEVVIPHTEETVYDNSKVKGTVTETKGEDGLKTVTYLQKTVNGAVTEKTTVSETILKEAVNAQKVLGAKASAAKTSAKKTAVKANAVTTSSSVKCVSTLTPSAPIQLDANGNPVNYKSKLTARATAYTYTGNNCSTGVAPQPGYIAVNPKVIPYGTKMYIKTADGSQIYGYAVAADTGGFIKNHPTGVDLFMSTRNACINFGVRNVEIYILE